MTEQDRKIQEVLDQLAALVASETRRSVLTRLGRAGHELERALEQELTGPERRDAVRAGKEPFFVRAQQRRQELSAKD